MAPRGLSFDQAKVELEAGYVLTLFSGSHKSSQFAITPPILGTLADGRPVSFKNAKRLIGELGLVKHDFFDTWSLPRS